MIWRMDFFVVCLNEKGIKDFSFFFKLVGSVGSDTKCCELG